MSNTRAAQIIEALSALKAQRSTLDRLYEDCAFFCMPGHQYIHNRQQTEEGEKSHPSDSHGIYCSNSLSSHLFSNTVSLGQKWFGLRAENEELNKSQAVKAWHSETADRAIKELAESNFALQIHECLQQLVTFGTAVVYAEYDEDAGGPVFRTYRITDCWIAEDHKGNVDTLYREFSYTAKQCYDKWGDSCSPETKKNAESPAKCQTKVKIVHAVHPRMKRDVASKTSDNMPWASCYVELDQKHLLNEGGYQMFPFACPRFTKVDGAVYGISPAMMAMDDLRMLNRAVKDFIDALEQETCPPVVLPPGMSKEDFDMRPAAVNENDDPNGGEVKQLLPNVNLVPVENFIARREEKISDMFFLNLFMALEAQNNMTATEVVERVNEKIQGVAPVVSRLQSELYSVLLRRVVFLLGSNGKLSEPPEELGEGGEAFSTIEYTTRLDAKLADVETSQLVRSIEQAAFIVGKAEEIPQLKYIIKVDDAVRQVFHNNRVDPDILQSEEEGEELRQADEAAAQQAQVMEMMQQMTQPVDMQKAAEPGSPAEDMSMDMEQPA